MKFIDNISKDCYFNLAAEEYLLKGFEEEFFMLWQNDNTIVVGRNQNTLAEINAEYVRKKGIHVVRRMSGGGAVYHDLGNVNYTFIENRAESFSDFSRFSQQVIRALKTLGVEAHAGGRNDLLIGDKKFSGNAQYVYRNRILHHGTLLFDSDLSKVSQCLKADPEKFRDKGIKSVKSRVTNLSGFMPEPMTVEEFKETLKREIEYEEYCFSQADIEAIEQLKREKYETYGWNFGYSPNYEIVNRERFSRGTVEFRIHVVEGKIAQIQAFGDFFSKCDLAGFYEQLKGVSYQKQEIKKVLKDTDCYFAGIETEKIINLLCRGTI